MTDLDKLIKAVEAGSISTDTIMDAIDDPRDQVTCLAAFDGSLDAAKALFFTLLPEWIFDVTNDSALVMRPDAAEVFSFDWDRTPCQFQADGEPARAWLLATLRAHRSQVQP